jgi:hypothetical protein
MQRSIRNLATAFALGAAAALVIDAALQNALDAARSPGTSSLTPWWVVGRVIERSTWVAAALLVRLAAPSLARMAWATRQGDALGLAAASELAGRVLIGAPIVWLLANWLVWIAKMTLVGSWASEGRLFLAPHYYSTLLLWYLPWAGGGVVLLTLKRHVPVE